jgi:hypothetical protein
MVAVMPAGAPSIAPRIMREARLTQACSATVLRLAEVTKDGALCLQGPTARSMLSPGAARFGRRMPGPHDWHAAPHLFMRGGCRRGAGMDDDDTPCSPELAALQNKSKVSWLSVNDAALAFSPVAEAEEVLRLVAQGAGVVRSIMCFPLSSSQQRLLDLDVELSQKLLEKLNAGTLVARGFENGASAFDEPRLVPGRFWQTATLYPTANSAETFDGRKIVGLEIAFSAIAVEDAPVGREAELYDSSLQKKTGSRTGRPPSSANIYAKFKARQWLLDNGEDLKSETGKQSECEGYVSEALTAHKEDLSLSESSIREIVKAEARKIAAEKKAGKAGN